MSQHVLCWTVLLFRTAICFAVAMISITKWHSNLYCKQLCIGYISSPIHSKSKMILLIEIDFKKISADWCVIMYLKIQLTIIHQQSPTINSFELYRVSWTPPPPPPPPQYSLFCDVIIDQSLYIHVIIPYVHTFSIRLLLTFIWF